MRHGAAWRTPLLSSGEAVNVLGAAAPRLPGRRETQLAALLTVGAPLGVLALLVVTGVSGGSRALGVLLALVAVMAVVRWPGAGLGVMLAYVPLQLILLPLLFHLGLPAGLVRALGGVKEIVTLGVLVAGVRAFRRSGRRLDLLDWLEIGFVVLVSIYLVAPALVPGSFADLPWNVRLLAWRADALWLVLFFGARHLVIAADTRLRLARLVFVLAAVVGVGAVVEFSDPSAWNSFLVDVIHVPTYKAVILNVYVPNPTDVLYHGQIGGLDFIRVGSVLQSPLTLGFYLYPALAIGLHYMADRRLRWGTSVATALAGAAVVMTLTRSALLGAVVLSLVSVRVGIARLSPGRVRLVLVLVATAVIAAPLGGSTILGQRTVATFSGQQDANTHLQSAQAGFQALLDDPLGRGLGTAPGIGDRFQVQGKLTSEDAYLQVGDELGVAAMVIFMAFLGVTLSRLRRTGDGSSDGLPAPAMFAAGVGLAVGGLFLHVWLDYSTALTFAALAGVSISVASGTCDGRGPDPELPVHRPQRRVAPA